MGSRFAALSLLMYLLAVRPALADPQTGNYTRPPTVAAARPSVSTSAQVPANQVLELAPLRGYQLPPAPAPMSAPHIPSPFLGCWEAKPDRFDMVVDSFGGATIGSPGRIEFCYRQDRIEVPRAEIHFGAGDWLKNVLFHFGTGITLTKLDSAGIRTEIYEVTSSQILARTFVPMKVTDLRFWTIPASQLEVLTDEELATAEPNDTIRVQARQELVLPGFESVRFWHADFHRVPS
jgi:hypothetical protein